MQITINGQLQEVAESSTLTDLLELLSMPSEYIAVAVNGTIVRRSDRTSTTLHSGDEVEVLSPTQGG